MSTPAEHDTAITNRYLVASFYFLMSDMIALSHFCAIKGKAKNKKLRAKDGRGLAEL
jgi:hypothetical protein